MTETGVVYYKAESLKEYCTKLFESVGIPNDQACIISESLVFANLRGVDSHGVVRMGTYMPRLKVKVVEPVTKVEIERQTVSAALVDGKNGMGAVVGSEAMKIAIDKAAQTGIGVVGVKHSNHFGTAAYFTMKALGKDMVGIAMSNAPSSMAPWGGRKAFLGTNPISISVPAAECLPIVFDMATSVVARGKIILAAKKGEKIPEGWAINKDGEVTTDAQEALNGAVLPFGGPKGYAIALLIDVFSGILSGAAFGPHINNLYTNLSDPQNVGHFFMAIDINKFVDIDLFKKRMDQMIKEIKQVDPAKGIKEVLVPGEIEFATEKQRSQTGIPLNRVVVDELKQLGEEYGVDWTLSDLTLS